MTENYKPPQNPYLRIIPLPKRTLIVLGLPGGKTFDITPEQGTSLGLALMETALHLKKLAKENKAMPQKTIEERVATIIVEHLGVGPEKVTPSARIEDDLGADSLDFVEVIMAFEEEFGVTIDDDLAATVKTVAEAVAVVTELTK